MCHRVVLSMSRVRCLNRGRRVSADSKQMSREGWNKCRLARPQMHSGGRTVRLRDVHSGQDTAPPSLFDECDITHKFIGQRVCGASRLWRAGETGMNYRLARSRMIAMVLFASMPLRIRGKAQQVPAPRTVDLKARDGVILKATYLAGGKPGRGLLLQPGKRERKACDDLAAQQAASGVNVLRMDFRGFGDNFPNRRSVHNVSFTPSEWRLLHLVAEELLNLPYPGKLAPACNWRCADTLCVP